MSVPEAPRVAAVVTAYRTTAELLPALESLLAQVERVVIVNDAPGRSEEDQVLPQAAKLGAIVIDHGRNRGIAAALNTGIQALRSQQPELAAVLTCDQDSLLPTGYVETLVASWRQAAAAGVQVGMVAPAGAGNIRRLPGTQGHDEVLIGGEPIQSGLLIPVATLDAVGEFDESLFIDGVDSDFYLRALDAGLVPVVAPARIAHQLGRTVQVQIGPLRTALTVAADYRYYYRVRNLISLGTKNLRRHPGWVLRAWGKELRHQLITTALAPGRRARVRMSLRGLRDGVRRRGGALAG